MKCDLGKSTYATQWEARLRLWKVEVGREGVIDEGRQDHKHSGSRSSLNSLGIYPTSDEEVVSYTIEKTQSDAFPPIHHS